MAGILKLRNLKNATFIFRSTQAALFSTEKKSPVYELRTYGIHPKDLKPFLELSTEWMDVRCSHSKLLGYWISEIGGISDVCHIWEYDDLKHRANVRLALSKDSDWMTGYIGKAMPMLRYQDNLLLALNEDCKLVTDVKPGGVYELQILAKAMDAKSGNSGEDKSTLLARFNTIIGPTNTEVRLWHHESMEVATDFTKRNFSNIKSTGHSRLLLPAPWSPWK